MNKITCRCVCCGALRTLTEDDPIDEDGPCCEVCFGPMIPVKAETTRKTKRDEKEST